MDTKDKKDSQVEEESEPDEACKRREAYLVVFLKTCWYLVTLVMFIFAASVIFMGIEGNHERYTSLKNYQERIDFEHRLMTWIRSNKTRAKRLRNKVGLNAELLNEKEYHEKLSEQYQRNYSAILKYANLTCYHANLQLKSWNGKTWGDSFMYSASIMSTVGWGVFYPPDLRLKIITLAYMFFGIPIFAALINTISGMLDSAERCLLKSGVVRKFIGDDKCVCSLQIIWVVLAVLLYAAVCDSLVEAGREDVIEQHLEDLVLNYSWTFFISIYYTITTVTSIGFGDIYVYSPSHVLLNLKPILCLFLTAFLIALFGRMFNKLKGKVDQVATKKSHRVTARARALRMGVIPVT